MNRFSGKKVGEIFETKDYSFFKFRKDNRVINPNHVKKLKKKMTERGWLPSSRVVVNGNGELIDGQHRVTAAMEVGVPVRYTVIKGADGDDICELNQLQKNWSPFDHIHRWVAKGNKHYIEFDNFINEFPMFKYTECAMFLNNNCSSVDRDHFEAGKYVVKDVKKAREWANNVLSLKPYFEKYYNKSIFVRALIKIMANKPQFKFNEFLHKVQIRPMNLVPCGTVEQYIEMIDKIYNYSRRGPNVNLRFLD